MSQSQIYPPYIIERSSRGHVYERRVDPDAAIARYSLVVDEARVGLARLGGEKRVS